MTAPEEPASPAPKIHVDSDWKAQAQAEKERLARQEQERAQERTGPDELPPAEFRTLVHMLASQAALSLGGYGDPKTGRVIVDLPGAKLTIDLLAVLEEKTKGNLTKDEADELRELLAELRSRFVQFADIVARQQAAQGAAAAGVGDIPGGAGGVLRPDQAASAAARLRTP